VLHLDFATAFRAHPFGPPFYLLFTISALMCGYGWFKGKYLDTNDRVFNRAMKYVVVVFVAFGLVRFALVKYDSPMYYFSNMARQISKEQ
jgi:hypothetical protein